MTMISSKLIVIEGFVHVEIPLSMYSSISLDREDPRGTITLTVISHRSSGVLTRSRVNHNANLNYTQDRVSSIDRDTSTASCSILA